MSPCLITDLTCTTWFSSWHMGGFVLEHASSQEVPAGCLRDGPHGYLQQRDRSKGERLRLAEWWLSRSCTRFLVRVTSHCCYCCWRGSPAESVTKTTIDNNNKGGVVGLMVEGRRILVGFSILFCVTLLLSSIFGYLVREASQLAHQETFHVSDAVSYHRHVPVDQCVNEFVPVALHMFLHLFHWVFHFYGDVSSTDEEVWCYTCGCEHDAHVVPWPTHSLQYNTGQVGIEANNRGPMFLEWRVPFVYNSHFPRDASAAIWQWWEYRVPYSRNSTSERSWKGITLS